ncbi:hypothetical protein FSARC_4280 [Fusarium sarcochroum]|uniref:EKC/KEOPS complex subunit BUD32 n=1 Tax=Fusarium sarcochroum TaxID=1208366 RepID=A0A8H4U2L1_9HYPO|nr:hypothetical protein FSARC_4280 [Fusarium sarcochroum]
MFDPVTLNFTTWPQPSYTCYEPTERFPFCQVKTIPRSSSSDLQKFEIHEEYCHDLVKEHMERWPGSTKGHGSDRKPSYMLFLARSYLLCIPYIESDLERQLLALDGPRVSRTETLPNVWLWEQLVGVSEALKTIHTGISEGDSGRVIISHFDLRPANILVTADKKLKITDFGQSYIEWVKDGNKDETFYNSGHPRYAPHESLLMTGEETDLAKEKEPAKLTDEEQHNTLIGQLNYDVWSLACIMTEVLVYLCDGPTKVEELRKTLKETPMKDRFFIEKDKVMRLKPCVERSIHSIQQSERFQDDIAHERYIKDVANLLFGMFDTNQYKRPSSGAVLERLKQAESTYTKNLRTQDDPLAQEVLGLTLSCAGDELGWVDGSGLIVSFAEICQSYRREKRTEKRAVPFSALPKPTKEALSTTDNKHQKRDRAIIGQGTSRRRGACWEAGRFASPIMADFVFTRKYGRQRTFKNARIQFWAKSNRKVANNPIAPQQDQSDIRPVIDTMAIFVEDKRLLIEIPIDNNQNYIRSDKAGEVDALTNTTDGHNAFESYWSPRLEPWDRIDQSSAFSITPPIRPGAERCLFRRKEAKTSSGGGVRQDNKDDDQYEGRRSKSTGICAEKGVGETKVVN